MLPPSLGKVLQVTQLRARTHKNTHSSGIHPPGAAAGGPARPPPAPALGRKPARGRRPRPVAPPARRAPAYLLLLQAGLVRGAVLLLGFDAVVHLPGPGSPGRAGRGAGRGRARPLFPSPRGGGRAGGLCRGSGGAGSRARRRRAGGSGSARETPGGGARRRRTEEAARQSGPGRETLESEGGREGRKEERMGRGRALLEGPQRVGEVAGEGPGRPQR